MHCCIHNAHTEGVQHVRFDFNDSEHFVLVISPFERAEKAAKIARVLCYPLFVLNYMNIYIFTCKNEYFNANDENNG